jgi:hypothetical protein
MNVIAIHLISGQTILGRHFFDADTPSDNIKVLKPMSLIVQQGNAQGQLAVSMMPFLTNGVFPVLEEFEFEQHHIMMVRDVPTQLEKLYNEMTSGIAMAPANSKFAL